MGGMLWCLIIRLKIATVFIYELLKLMKNETATNFKFKNIWTVGKF